MSRTLARALAPSLSAAVALAAALGCSETDLEPASQLRLDRPNDITFACFGGLRITNGDLSNPSQPIEITAMPTTACDQRSVPRANANDPAPVPFGQEDLTEMGGEFLPAVSWYGLILQGGPGTVAISRFETKPSSAFAGADVEVVDADPLTPGSNSISVGEDPIAIATDRAGCHAITANAGSCDLSVLDIPSALDTDPAVKVNRLDVKNASGGLLRARPAAMVAEPAAGVIGQSCSATPSGLVYLAYPSCHFVGAVDTSTGTLVGGIRYDDAGIASILTQVEAASFTCPAECGAGEAITPGVRPVTLDLRVDPNSGNRRLVIGADNSAAFTLVELDVDLRPTAVSQISFSDPDGDLGITAIALSPEIGMGGNGKVIDDDGIGGQFQFVYAVATDRTVRVADVLDVNRECDTQIDGRFARNIGVVRDLACLPVDEPGGPPRRPGRGPGIALPGVPLSVTFIRSEGDPSDPRTDENPEKLVGYFAMVTTTNGATFIVNVDDDNYPDVFSNTAPLAVSMQHAMPHQVRDAIGRRYLTIDDEDTPDKSEDNQPCEYDGGTDGGPRVLNAVQRLVPTGSLATAKLTQLPGLRQLACERNMVRRAIPETAYAAPVAVRDRVFPDLGGLPSAETWSFTWEGSLSNDVGDSALDGPAVRESEIRVDERGMRIVDHSRPFCTAGVEPYDIVQLRGCDPSFGNGDCPSGYSCFVHPETQVAGLGACMLSDEADRLADACKDFLTTNRRYTVKATSSGELLLLPRRVELRTTPLDGCVDDAQCEALGDYAATFGLDVHPSDPKFANTKDDHVWACVADGNRAPLGGTGKRCEMRCGLDANGAGGTCSAGSVCIGATAGQANSGFCMEGVIPSQSCINAPQRYELRAGEAFAVLGTRSGFVHPIIEDASGQCVRNPSANPVTVGRMPLRPKNRVAPYAPLLCDPAADPLTGALPGGGFEPNPCITTVTHAEPEIRFVPGTCTLEGDDSTLIEREAPAIRFRMLGMNLTFVDPYYPGDKVCISDRAGDRGMIPHILPGYTYSFRQTLGLSLKALPISATFPSKVVRGPTDSIWVIDQGDFLSSSVFDPSTRGKVFRVESRALTLVNTLQ